MTRWFLGIGVAFGITTATSVLSAADAPAEKLEFGRDVRAILSNNCFKCHGPDEKQRQAGLRLDQRDGATAKLASTTSLASNEADSNTIWKGFPRGKLCRFRCRKRCRSMIYTLHVV